MKKLKKILKVLWYIVGFLIPIFVTYCLINFVFGNTVKKVEVGGFVVEKKIE